jgi:hypothetical protein
MSPVPIVRCPSCDGYGWLQDEPGEPARDCDWCAGVGYVYRENGIDRVIPAADYVSVTDALEQLEMQRLREMGYSGQSKKPWEQTIRGENARRLRGGG